MAFVEVSNPRPRVRVKAWEPKKKIRSPTQNFDLSDVMMVKGKGWETPTMDSANIKPGNFYAVYEALLQGHQAAQYELITSYPPTGN